MILSLVKNRMRNSKTWGRIMVLVIVFMLLILTVNPGMALAVSLEDIVAEIASRNTQNVDSVIAGTEPVSGGSFDFYEVGGDYSSGLAYFSICDPKGLTSMQAVLDFATRNLDEDAIMRTVPMTGYELREITYADYSWGLPNNEVEVWVVLPNYLIKAYISDDTGNSKEANLQTAKNFALQIRDSMQRAGFLSPESPTATSPEPTGEQTPDAPAAAVTGKALAEPVKVSDTMNIAGVRNNPTAPMTLSINKPHLVTFITTYHWNNARGAAGGTIALKDQNGKVYGPWKVTTRPGQGNVPNAYWEVSPNIVIPAGTYTVVDSDPSTWSQNAQSDGRGMGEVRATPHFEISSGNAGNLNNGIIGSGKTASAGRTTESPAGVGTVGNIPGPANTTEAVVGVVVPGLLATGLGALAGLGGGGGFPTPGGTPFVPSAGGPAPGAAGNGAGAGNASSSAAPNVNQLGRRRREEEIYVSGPETNPVIRPEPVQPQDQLNEEIYIDTVEMFEEPRNLSGRPADQGMIIDTADEAGVFVQPKPDIFIETAEEGAVIHAQPESEIFIDPAIEGGVIRVQPESGLLVETVQEEAGVLKPDSGILYSTPENEILIDTSALEGAPAPEAEAAATLEREATGVETPADLENEATILSEENVYDSEGFDQAGFDKEGFNAEGFDKEGYNEAGFDAEGYNREGFDQAGFDKEGVNAEGFDKDGFNKEGFNAEGFDKEGFNKEGFDQEGFDREGFDSKGFDKDGFDKDGFNKEGFNAEGFDKEGFNAEGFDKEGYNEAGFDAEGYNREGFDQAGFDKEGVNAEGFDKDGFNKEGFNKEGFDQEGFDREGFDSKGFDKDGFDKDGFNKAGFDKDGFNKDGFNKQGYDKDGFNKEGFDREGFNEEGFDREGFNKAGFDKDGFNKEGFNKDGFNKQGYDKEGFNQEGFDQEGFNKEGFNKQGFDKEGFNKDGFNKDGFDREGFNREGFDKNGFDREGYGKNGFDREGYNREGYDVNGYDRKGYNRSGYDAKGYDRQGYDKAGFNKEGWDRDGYDRNGLNKEGYDREGYDKAGYDKDGYDRDGYDREGMEREGYDADGYDKDGFNKNGVDKDGYDREGFNYEGYNREGYDPWGYDKQGYGKDGYHWSGYNADGYNRDGRHWSENPFEGDGNPFNVGIQDPFGEGEVIPFGAKWVPTKPKLGEPYPRTVEKYGPKPWTDEIPKPEPEKPAIPATDTGVIGPEDPTNTLENHELDKGAPAAPEGQDGTSLPVPEEDLPETGPDGRDIPEQQVKTGDSDTFTYTDPETGETSAYEYEKGYTGPRHGDTQILVGKSDGQTYELEFDAVKGKWVNTESGNEFYPDDFDRWQNDLAEDKRRSAIDLEKMAKREDATSKAIKQNREDWHQLEQMQKAADKHNIGEPGGPGDVDKAIEDLKKDMLDGKELDREKMAKIRRIIDNRILGKTTGDTGERWEEDWFKNLGWALEANAATAKEVVTGEKADGSISWLGITARIMITAATGGGASLTTFAGELTRQGAMDGILTVAEAMYRIKDSIDKGESDFRAVSKALGMVILGEEIGWLAGQAGGKIMGEMLERFPAFTNKAADLLEKLILTGKAGDQMLSRAFGFVSKESAEEALDQINKRLVDLGGDATADYIKKGSKALDLGVSDSFVDVSKGTGKGFAGSPYDDIATGFGKAPSSSADISAGSGRAASSSDDIAGELGKAASSSGDDLTKGAGKATPGSDIDTGAGKTASRRDDMAQRAAGTADSPQAPDGPGAPQRTAGAGGDAPDGPPRTGDAGGDGPGDPGGRPPGHGGGDGPVDPGGPPRGDGDAGGTLNPNARTPEEVLADPAAVTRAENTVRNSTRDFDNLPPARQQELIREQAIYDEYRMQAQERNYNLADKVQRGERISVEDVMEMKADPASMRTLKNLERTGGIGAELGELRTRQVQTEFNQVLDTQVHQPSYRAVEDHLSARYNGAQTRCNTVRTPGTEDVPWNINTDNDVIAERLVVRPDGTTEWVEIPKREWEDVYYESFARNSGFSVDEATRRFPDRDWANMDNAARCREWANLHEETPMDVFDPMAARDYSNQRTAILNGERPCGPLFDRDGNMLRDPIDAEQLGMMEKHKANDYWNKGETPAEIMRNQTESLEQVRKTANVVRNLEGGTHNMPPNMQEAISVINNNNLSPALRAARLRELGYDTPGDLIEKLTSRIGSFRTGNR